MRTVSLMGTDLSTSRLGFGTSGLHQLLRSRHRQDLLAAAFAAGVRHFDTSPFYGHGIAEAELGRFAPRHRQKILLASKFGIKPHPLLARIPWLMYAQLSANAMQRRISKKNRWAITPARDYGAREARLSLERSLRAMQTDHVDIYFLHDPSRSLLEPSEELIATLARLRQEGKTRYIGLAGSAGHCIALAQQFPTVAQVLQISAAAGPCDLALLHAAALPCHLSFGHFRDKHESTRSLLQHAIKQNPAGVVLYSSRHPARITEIAAYLAELEPG
jgi:aryl-alcohol dehydrogenase-like predicted oxidoreductase